MKIALFKAHTIDYQQITPAGADLQYLQSAPINCGSVIRFFKLIQSPQAGLF
jgi:hypothetical protein